MSASNWASLADEDVVVQLERDGNRWATFLDLEVAACAAPGALDGGPHILFAARPNTPHEISDALYHLLCAPYPAPQQLTDW